MNYYNPYFFTNPGIYSTPIRTGLFSRLFGGSGITFSGILNGTQRALSFANQAIPFVKQVKPMIGNAKTMFKVMNEFKRVEKPNLNKSYNNNYTNTNNNNNSNLNDGPTFFA